MSEGVLVDGPLKSKKSPAALTSLELPGELASFPRMSGQKKRGNAVVI